MPDQIRNTSADTFVGSNRYDVERERLRSRTAVIGLVLRALVLPLLLSAGLAALGRCTR